MLNEWQVLGARIPIRNVRLWAEADPWTGLEPAKCFDCSQHPLRQRQGQNQLTR